MEDDTGGSEGNFDVLLTGLHPVKDLLHVRFLHGEVVAVAHGALEEHANGVGELLDAVVAQGGELVKVVVLAVVPDGLPNALVEGVGLGAAGESHLGGFEDSVVALGSDEFLHIRLNFELKGLSQMQGR